MARGKGGQAAAPAAAPAAPDENQQASGDQSQAPAAPAPAAPAAPAPAASPKPADKASKKAASEEVVTVIVAIAVGGLRDGVPWPKPGEEFTLPADEADSYIQFGYVVPKDAAAE